MTSKYRGFGLALVALSTLVGPPKGFAAGGDALERIVALTQLLTRRGYAQAETQALSRGLILRATGRSKPIDILRPFVAALGTDHELVRPLYPKVGNELREWTRFFFPLAKRHYRRMKVDLDANGQSVLEFSLSRGQVAAVVVRTDQVTFPLLLKPSRIFLNGSGIARASSKALGWIGPRTKFDLLSLVHESAHHLLENSLTSTQRETIAICEHLMPIFPLEEFRELDAVIEDRTWILALRYLRWLRRKGVDPLPGVQNHDLSLVRDSAFRTYVDKSIWEADINRAGGRFSAQVFRAAIRARGADLFP